jgi:hypothetical protein
MSRLNYIAGSGLALMLAVSAAPAWSQTVPVTSVTDSASLMDQNLSREIKQAWSEGKNATAAMAFQENGEIALSEGRNNDAKQYFSAAEHELATLQPHQSGE